MNNIKQFSEAVLNNKDLSDLFLICNTQVTERQLQIASIASDLRCLVNEEKGITSIAKYQRKNNDQIAFMSLLTETHLSILLFKLYMKSNKKIKVKSPSMANVFLEKNREDFQFIDAEKTLDIDLKSQYIECTSKAVNINYDAHKRALESNSSDGYIVAIIKNRNDDYTDYKNVESIYYFFMSHKFIEEQSTLVDKSTYINFTPYYKIPINLFLNKIA